MYSLPRMAEKSLPDRGIRHSAVYSYLRPILVGRRVLELGCGTGESAAHLARLGARSVVGADDSGAVAQARTRQNQGNLSFLTLTAASLEQTGPFDVVLIPEAAEILLGRASLTLPAVLKLVAPGGRLVCVVPNGDRPGGSAAGLSYFDVVDRLSPHFPKVRMFGQTPFAAWGIAEFDEAPAELRVESDLAQAEGEEASHYLALCGHDEPLSLGYALVQIPPRAPEASAVEKPAPEPRAQAEASDAALAELRRSLAEAQGQAEGLVRVSRAQSEEIEELRGRVRRTAEARAELDQEVQRLRRALLEADESVVNLTRKTTDEMTVLAQRLTAGLRPSEPTPAPALTEELKRREAELARRESAVSERDDRIAALEAARQEAIWRADAAEDGLGRLRAEMVELRRVPPATGPTRDELLATLKVREQALEEFQRAAAAHLDEAGRQREALNEQSSLVAELEEDLATAEKRLAEALEEAVRLRRSVVEVEEADRQRRSRLAELEGVMLRLRHGEAETKAQAQDEAAQAQKRIADLEMQAVDLRTQLGETERRLADSLRLRDDTERARKQTFTRVEEMEAGLQASAARVSELEIALQASVARVSELEIALQASVARASELETTLQASVAPVSELETALQTSVARVSELEIALQASVARASELEIALQVAQVVSTSAAQLEGRLAIAESAAAQIDDLQARLKTAEAAAARVGEMEALLRIADSKMVRLAQLEVQNQVAEEAAAKLAELRAEAPDPEEVFERLGFLESQHDAAMLAAARVPSLEAELAMANACIAELRARLAGNS
jgi:SAM-dependent methyltransferase